MNPIRSIAVLLAVLVPCGRPCLASAQWLGAAPGGASLLEGVRGRAEPAPAVPGGRAVDGVLLADYRTIRGNPVVELLGSPGSFSETHIEALMGAMIEIEAKKRGRNPLTLDSSSLQLRAETMFRLAQRMRQIDAYFVDPVPAGVWDAVIADMTRTAEALYDPVKGNWDAVADRMLKKAAEGLKDPFSVYWTAKEFKTFQDYMNSKFVGIGVSLKEDDGGVSVDFVYPGSPAQRAGLKGGDRIVSIDGVSLEGRPLQEAVKRLGGVAGSQVRLGVARGGRSLAVTAKRGEVKLRDVQSRMAAPGVGYVRLEGFNEGADKKVVFAVQLLQLRGARKLVLDLRGNPGGSTAVVASLASEFLKDGQTIVSYGRRKIELTREVADGNGRFARMPLALLVDGGSASASEILAGALQDHGRAVVVGSGPTYGKGVAQAVLPDKTGAALKLTIMRWYTPKGRNIDGKHDPKTGERLEGTGGVRPDVVVPMSEEQEAKLLKRLYRRTQGAAEGGPLRDPALEKALELLKARR